MSISVGEGLHLVRHAMAELKAMRSDESFEAVCHFFAAKYMEVVDVVHDRLNQRYM